MTLKSKPDRRGSLDGVSCRYKADLNIHRANLNMLKLEHAAQSSYDSAWMEFVDKWVSPEPNALIHINHGSILELTILGLLVGSWGAG